MSEVILGSKRCVAWYCLEKTDAGFGAPLSPRRWHSLSRCYGSGLCGAEPSHCGQMFKGLLLDICLVFGWFLSFFGE